MVDKNIEESVCEFIDYQKLIFTESHQRMLTSGADNGLALHFATLMLNASLASFYTEHAKSNKDPLEEMMMRLSPGGNA